MSKKKIFTVNDFIIFLKNRIAIILLSTLLIAGINIYIQKDVGSKNHWEVKISRTIDTSSVMKVLNKINVELKAYALRYDLVKVQTVDAMSLMKSMNELMDIIMINFLSNQNIEIDGLGKNEDYNLMVKQFYNLKVPYNNSKDLNILNNNLNKFFLNTNNLVSSLMNETYNLDETFNLKVSNFKIENIEKMSGYNYLKFIKILLTSFTFCSAILFVIHIRKSIHLF